MFRKFKKLKEGKEHNHYAHWNISKATAKAHEILEEIEHNGAPPPGREQAPVFMTSQMKLAVEQNEREELASQQEERVLYVRRVTEHFLFQTLVMVVIAMNTITVALETGLDPTTAPEWEVAFYHYCDAVYLAIYTAEFILKVYADRWLYFRNEFNRFDAFILAISYLQMILSAVVSTASFSYIRVFRAFRALRAFRSVSFIRSLQVIVSALVRTLKLNAVDILLLLFLAMYIFGVMGHYLFGLNSENQPTGPLSSLPSAFYVLFVYVTVDGWTSYQQELWDLGFSGSEWYTLCFVFIGGFIFTNLFIAVICQNIDDATEADRAIQTKRRAEMKQMKKDVFAERQKADMNQLLARKEATSQNMQELLASLAGTLRHDEVLPMTHLACDIVWLETYMVSLHYHENTVYRCQQTRFNIANTLCNIVERRHRTTRETDA